MLSEQQIDRTTDVIDNRPIAAVANEVIRLSLRQGQSRRHLARLLRISARELDRIASGARQRIDKSAAERLSLLLRNRDCADEFSAADIGRPGGGVGARQQINTNAGGIDRRRRNVKPQGES